MIQVCQFGAGRIGSIHAANLAAHPGARLRYVVDVDAAAAAALAQRHGAEVTDQATALRDPEVGMVVIASSTDTHADLILAAAQAGKAIFCEKPIHLELARVRSCVQAVRQSGVPMLVGFNRRFDPHFSAVQRAVREGAIGKVELVNITSRDPSPPPLS
jgi:myo-inositol 2-dehydrogenase/D-chiro-inositol 1-dehydrogenase